MKTEAAMKRTLLFVLITVSYLTLYCQNAIPPSAGDGSVDDPFQIETMENLFWAYCSEEYWDKAFIQTDDIDAAETYGWFQDTGWLPIGVYVGIDDPGNMPFTGSYDGQNHAISNLYINRPRESYSGLFGYVTGAEIRNVNLIFASVTGDRCVGGLAGVLMDESTLENCCMTGQASGSSNVGGMIGWASSSEIRDCSVESTVEGGAGSGGLIGFSWELIIEDCTAISELRNSHSQGGLIGEAEHSIIRCCSTRVEIFNGQVSGGLLGHGMSCLLTDCTSNSTLQGSDYSGGFVGTIYSSEVSSCSCATELEGDLRIGGFVGATGSTDFCLCYCSGTVVGTDQVAGGFSGYSSNPNYDSCYSQVDVSGMTQIGGFIGYMTGSDIRDCYATGDVSGSTNVGGFIGDGISGIVRNSFATGHVDCCCRVGGFVGVRADLDIESCYWNTETSGMEESQGGEGRTTDEMTWPYATNTYVGWDFDHVWLEDESGDVNGGYPAIADFVPTSNPTLTPEFTGSLLHNNYPNPFNPSTTIDFSIGESCHVKLEVFNTRGQRVKRLADSIYPRGRHSTHWLGVDESGDPVSSGIYFYRLEVEGGQVSAKKMLLLK